MQKYFFLFIILATALFACKPETIHDIGQPFDKLKSMEGNWQLQKVVQADLNAIKYGFPYKEIDITSKAPFTEFKVAFTLNNGSPAAFTTTPGGSPKIINLPSGSWKVDNAQTPKLVTLINNLDTVKLDLATYSNLGNGQLQLRVTKRLDGKDLLRYDYYFKKI